MDRLDPFFGPSRRHPEQPANRSFVIRQAGAIIEIVLIESEAAIRLQIDQVVEDGLCEPRLAIGGKPHDFVFAGIDPEARVIGESRIQQAKRMREVDLL